MMSISSLYFELRCEVVFGVVGVVPEEFPRCADFGILGIVMNNVAKVEAFWISKKSSFLFLKKAQNGGVEFSSVCQVKVIPSVGVE